MARESTLSMDGLILSHRCAGDPRSPWLILLHGWPQSKSDIGGPRARWP